MRRLGDRIIHSLPVDGISIDEILLRCRRLGLLPKISKCLNYWELRRDPKRYVNTITGQVGFDDLPAFDSLHDILELSNATDTRSINRGKPCSKKSAKIYLICVDGCRVR